MSPHYQADLATERKRQLTTARANQTTGLTNGQKCGTKPIRCVTLHVRGRRGVALLLLCERKPYSDLVSLLSAGIQDYKYTLIGSRASENSSLGNMALHPVTTRNTRCKRGLRLLLVYARYLFYSQIGRQSHRNSELAKARRSMGDRGVITSNPR